MSTCSDQWGTHACTRVAGHVSMHRCACGQYGNTPRPYIPTANEVIRDWLVDLEMQRSAIAERGGSSISARPESDLYCTNPEASDASID